MSEEKNLEIEQALEAVRNIREVVKGNIQIVRPLFIDKHYLPLCWAASIVMGLFTVFLIVANNFINIEQASWIKTVSIIYFIAIFSIFSIWKLILISRYAKEDSNTSLGSFMKLPEIYNLMVDCGCTMITIIILCLVIGFKLGSMWVFLPGSFLYLGIILFLCGDMYSIVEYRVLAILTFAFSIVIAIFLKTHFLLWLSASFTVYFAFLAITLLVSGNSSKANKDC